MGKIGDPDATKTKNDTKATPADQETDTDTTYTVGVKKVITQVGFYTVMFGGGFGFFFFDNNNGGGFFFFTVQVVTIIGANLGSWLFSSK